MASSFDLESLESRTFLAATPQVLLAHKRELHEAIIQYHSVKENAAGAIFAARQAMMRGSDRREPIPDPGLKPLIAQYRLDIFNRNRQYNIDIAAYKAQTKVDEQAIKNNQAAVRAAVQSGDNAALGTATAALNASRVKLAQDQKDLGFALEDHIIANETRIRLSGQAIVDRIGTKGHFPTLASRKQNLINQRKTQSDKVSNAHKNMLTMKLIVAIDKWG